MSLWPLLDNLLPNAGQLTHPFAAWQDFFSANMITGDQLDLLAAFLRSRQNGSNKPPLMQSGASLEYAVRLAKNEITAVALIGVPLAGATMADSLAIQRNLLLKMAEMGELSPAESGQIAELFSAIYPPDSGFDLLAPQARALLCGLAFGKKSNLPIIKPYFTTRLDNRRPHLAVLLSALAALEATAFNELVTDFEQTFGPISHHSGLGLDLVHGKPPRIKIYQRISWLEQERVTTFAKMHKQLVFNDKLWQLAGEFFCPDGLCKGLTSDFEVALVLAETPYFKLNFFFTAEAGNERGAKFLKAIGWPTDTYSAICQKGALELNLWATPHGLAFSLLPDAPETVNIYFIPRR